MVHSQPDRPVLLSPSKTGNTTTNIIDLDINISYESLVQRRHTFIESQAHAGYYGESAKAGDG